VGAARAFYYLDNFFGRSTENSIYRKRVVAYLGITLGDVVLDVACGTGNNFKILERYLKNEGSLMELISLQNQ